MTLERWIAAAFRLDECSWMRHANPWSVWTRFTVLPLLVAAFWSRIWLGWWFLGPVTLAVVWMWINPRLFPPPKSTDNWASKGVLGERIWLNRDQVPVPERHRVLPHILSGVGAVGGLLTIYGCAELAFWPALLGVALVYLGKLWFVDRMVWLYEDMRHATAEYESWQY